LWRKNDRFSGKRRLELFGVLDQLKLLTCRHRMGQGQAQHGCGGQTVAAVRRDLQNMCDFPGLLIDLTGQ
jgi:hypothetical protein